MSDFTEQLRKNGKDLLHAGAIDVGLPDDGDLMIEAADRIEELEADKLHYMQEAVKSDKRANELQARLRYIGDPQNGSCDLAEYARGVLDE